MKYELPSEITVLREIATAVARERNVHKLLEEVIDIIERTMGMLRGTFTLLDGDVLKIAASARTLNAEERALGRYHIGEGITGIVAKTGKSEVVPDVRKDRRFLNRTKARKVDEPLSFVCVPLSHAGSVIGTLSADRRMTGDTRDLVRDVALLEIVANLCAEAAAVCREQCAEQDALREIAARAIAQNTGARGLRAILENVLMQTMFDAPSQEDVRKVLVTADCVRNNSAPILLSASGSEVRRGA